MFSNVTAKQVLTQICWLHLRDDYFKQGLGIGHFSCKSSTLKYCIFMSAAMGVSLTVHNEIDINDSHFDWGMWLPIHPC